MKNHAEQELRSLSAEANFQEWLTEHQFIDADATSFDIQLDQDWHRPGSESYIIAFSIIQEKKNAERSAKSFIGKACIKAPCSETMEEWIQRRKILEDLDIPTPRLHAASTASLIEERIEFTVEEAYRQGSSDVRGEIVRSLYGIYSSLLTAGFLPRVMHDMRSRGNDAVVIDFGEDLGGILREYQGIPGTYSAFGRNAVRATLGKSSLVYLDS